MFDLLIGPEKDSGGNVIHRPRFFSDFLREKARNYVAPTRSGTPRGEAVGLFNQKYAATLLALTSEDVKKQAQILGVSYGVLRKWRTESPFIKQVNAHAREFIEKFFNHIKDRVARSDEETASFLALPLEKLANTQIVGRQSYAEFDDGKLYSDWLMDDLFKRYVKMKRPLNNSEVHYRVEVLWVFDWIMKLRGHSTPIMDKFKSHRLPVLRTILSTALKILASQNPTDEQRRHAIFNLTCVAQALERLEEKDLIGKAKP
jgi:hypothetical protein